MQEGDPYLREVARRWEAAWSISGLACYGACLTDQFCALHYVPLPACTALASAEQQQHDVVVLRSKWQRKAALGGQCARAEAERSADCPVQLYSAPAAPPAARPGACSGAECSHRLEILLRVDWVRKDLESSTTVDRLLSETSRGACLGYCQTPYLCKTHLCPAHRMDNIGDLLPPGASRKVSRFVCPMPHDRVSNGRYHELFAFYCGDMCCLPGRWFSREETHKKSKEKRLRELVVPVSYESHTRCSPPDTRVERTDTQTRKENRRPAARKGRGNCSLLFAAAVVLEAVLLCGAVAAIAVLSTRDCGKGAAPSLTNTGAQLLADERAQLPRGTLVPDPRCPQKNRTLCFYDGHELMCAQCHLVKGNATAWSCIGRNRANATVILVVYESGKYTLRLDKNGIEPFCTTDQIHRMDSGRLASSAMSSVVVRTLFFDGAFAEAQRSSGGDGLQLVIVAAGMDTRAWRLRFEPRDSVYELDYPHHVLLGCDLTEPGWPEQLARAGYDGARPSLWVVEGLLVYLSRPDADAVLASVARLAGPRGGLVGDWMNEAYLASPLTASFRSVFSSLGCPFTSARDPGDLEAGLVSLGFPRVSCKGIGEPGANFGVVPEAQARLAELVPCSDARARFLPRHYVFHASHTGGWSEESTERAIQAAREAAGVPSIADEQSLAASGVDSMAMVRMWKALSSNAHHEIPLAAVLACDSLSQIKKLI
eukprot:m51a1_g1080 hypothetical protein (712) ;mRNA; f:19822-22443